MTRFQTMISLTGRRAVLLGVFASIVVAPPVAQAEQGSAHRPSLTARVSRWMGDPVKKLKGPEGFDVQFRLVGPRFDGTFTVEGLPQSVPEGEAFDVQLRLTNIGGKDIKVTGVMVTGEGMVLNTEVVEKNVDPKTVATVANFRVPPQSSVGSSFLITVVMSNGDKHSATLSFAKAK